MAQRIARPRPKVWIDTRTPGINDDLQHGFQLFSWWLYSTTDELFVCTDPANGAAEWVEVNAPAVHVDTRDPLPTDDAYAGFQVGTLWLNMVGQTLWVSVDDTDDAAVWIQTNTILTLSNRWMTASTTTADGQEACATAIAATPNEGILVKVNGVQVPVGDGAKDRFCYFSGDGGATARALTAVAAGDKLYWVGSIAYYQLSAVVDHVDFVYEE